MASAYPDAPRPDARAGGPETAPPRADGGTPANGGGANPGIAGIAGGDARRTSNRARGAPRVPFDPADAREADAAAAAANREAVQCFVCGQTNGAAGNWIFCGKCQTWTHTFCNMVGADALDANFEFACSRCSARERERHQSARRGVPVPRAPAAGSSDRGKRKCTPFCDGCSRGRGCVQGMDHLSRANLAKVARLLIEDERTALSQAQEWRNGERVVVDGRRPAKVLLWTRTSAVVLYADADVGDRQIDHCRIERQNPDAERADGEVVTVDAQSARPRTATVKKWNDRRALVAFETEAAREKVPHARIARMQFKKTKQEWLMQAYGCGCFRGGIKQLKFEAQKLTPHLRDAGLLLPADELKKRLFAPIADTGRD